MSTDESNGELKRVSNLMLKRDIEEVIKGQAIMQATLSGIDTRIRDLEQTCLGNAKDIKRNSERVDDLNADIKDQEEDIDKLKDRINYWGSLNSAAAVIAGWLGIKLG